MKTLYVIEHWNTFFLFLKKCEITHDNTQIARVFVRKCWITLRLCYYGCVIIRDAALQAKMELTKLWGCLEHSICSVTLIAPGSKTSLLHGHRYLLFCRGRSTLPCDWSLKWAKASFRLFCVFIRFISPVTDQDLSPWSAADKNCWRFVYVREIY